MAKKKTNTVKHTVIVYSFDKGITTEKELCEKYEVNKVILEEKEVIKKKL